MKTVFEPDHLIFQPPELSCVLYLPGLPGSGGKIHDRSPHGNIGTITGAIWKVAPGGVPCLSFDGVDDIIINSTPDWMSADLLGTIIVWFRKSVASYGTLFASADEAGTARYLEFYAATVLGVAQRNNDTADDVSGSTVINDGKWHMATLVSNGNAYTLYVDDKPAEALTINLGANTGDWFGDTANRDNFTLGVLKRSAIADYLAGELALIEVHRRVFSALDIKSKFNREKYFFGVW